MSSSVKNRRILLLLVAAGMAVALVALIKVIAADLPQVAHVVLPALKAFIG
ncbi:MAG: hypothetical protein ACR2OJ_17760 [Hyphomicrobiales bacterium]